ncbi:hypothetical protein OAI29_06115 [Amylibacter sp.]|nr:hypothetical protein [Amylibacter sp.]
MSKVTKFQPPSPLNTAVLFLVFNRLDTTKKVFKAIRQAKPPRLYIAADGARANKKGECKNVQEVRDYIMQNVDWDCDVKTLFRDQNLGCKYAVGGAITWFFENEEQGIILEDDCLPSQSFFWYCEGLLDKYKEDKSIYLISADSRGPDSFGMQEDYGFCKYPMIWGWASWASAWEDYDPELKDWPIHSKGLPVSISTYKPTVKFWKKVFQKMYEKEVDTWDYQFCYLLLKNKGKCIVPKFNLVSNLGFGDDATHTFDVESENANRKRYEINIPLNFAPNSESEKKINRYYDRNEFSKKPFIIRNINKFARLIVRNNLIK